MRLWFLEKTAMSAILWGDEPNCRVGLYGRLLENVEGDERIVLRSDDEGREIDVSQYMPGSALFIIITREAVDRLSPP